LETEETIRRYPNGEEALEEYRRTGEKQPAPTAGDARHHRRKKVVVVPPEAPRRRSGRHGAD
jgi:hypothetical protein